MKYTKIILALAMSLIALQVSAYPIELFISDKVGQRHQDENGETVLHVIGRECNSAGRDIPLDLNPWSKNKDGKTARDLTQEQPERRKCLERAAYMHTFEQTYLNNLLRKGSVKFDWTQIMVINSKKSGRRFVRNPYLNQWVEIKKAD